MQLIEYSTLYRQRQHRILATGLFINSILVQYIDNAVIVEIGILIDNYLDFG